MSQAANAQAPPPPAGHAIQVDAGHGLDQYLMPYEVPNFATLIESASNPHMAPHGGERPHPSEIWFVTPLYTIFYAILIVVIVRRALRKPSIEKPKGLQNAVELLLGGLRNFFIEVVGPENERFIPFVGSLWLYILVNNLAVLVPGFISPSSSFKMTIALGLCTFCYVHYNSIKRGGLWGWFHHLLGSPNDAVTWALSPMFLFLEIIGELIKPLSLSLRLFGNIFGEDKLLAIFLGLGMMLTAVIFGTPVPWVGIPLHMPFFFLVLLLSTIQATVFAILAAIYITLLLPHEEHEETPAATGAHGEERPHATASAETHG